MNIIKKILFKKKLLALQSNILCVLGYLPLSIQRDSVIKITDKMYSDIHLKINNLYDEFKKIHFNDSEFVLYSSLFRLVQAKQLSLFGELDKASLFLEDISKSLNQEHKLWNTTNFNWFNLNTKLLKIQINNDNWINEIESVHTNFLKLKNEKEKNIEDCYLQYNNLETNSPEHLIVAQKHLENYVELIHLKSIKEDKKLLSDNDKQQGKFLLNKTLELLKQISHINNNELMLKSLVLLEIIKLEYYIENDPKEMFDHMVEYCSLHIRMKNSDPIGYATGIYYPDILKEHLPIEKQESFKNYLYSFCLELTKQPNNEMLFNLKQLENFLANDISDRLKIIEPK